MATSKSTLAPAEHPDPRLAEIRERFGITGRIAHHPRIPGYAVTDCGRVFAWTVSNRHRDGSLREVTRSKQVARGYVYVRFYSHPVSETTTVHRLVAELFLPPPAQNQHCVRHLNGMPTDNRAENLAWGTNAENARDTVRHGRTLKGRKNPNAKLTDRIVVAARILVDEGFSTNALGVFLGVDGETVRRAVTREQWGHISGG